MAPLRQLHVDLETAHVVIEEQGALASNALVDAATATDDACARRLYRRHLDVVTDANGTRREGAGLFDRTTAAH